MTMRRPGGDDTLQRKIGLQRRPLLNTHRVCASNVFYAAVSVELGTEATSYARLLMRLPIRHLSDSNGKPAGQPVFMARAGT